MWVRGITIMVLLTVQASCSAIVEPDKDQLMRRPAYCSPAGCYSPCPCPGNTTGRQLCNEQGGFDDCACGPQAQNLGTVLCGGDAEIAAPGGSGSGG